MILYKAFLTGVAVASCLSLTSTAQSVELVSKAHHVEVAGLGDSGDVELSSNGDWALFVSNAGNLVPDSPVDLFLHVFLRNLNVGTNILVSRGLNGPANGSSAAARFHPQAEHVVFQSDASNLVPGDTNEKSDIFLYNINTGLITRLSIAPDAQEPNGNSGYPVFSPNGKQILFESAATNLVPNDTNAAVDLFIRDLEAGRTILVTANAENSGTAEGGPAAIGAFQASFSVTGRYVLYEYVTGAFLNDTLVPNQIYLRDLELNRTILVSADSSGSAGSGRSNEATISTDERYVAFITEAANFPGTGGKNKLAIKDLETGTLLVIAPPDEDPEGEFRKPVFRPGHLQFAVQWNKAVYLYNMDEAKFTLLSKDADENALDGTSEPELFSADGSKLLISSSATQLGTFQNPDGHTQLLLYDLNNKSLQLLTRNHTVTAPANSSSLFPSITAEGDIVAFTSADSDLVAIDNNGSMDLFLVRIGDTVSPAELISRAHPTVIASTGNLISSLGTTAFSQDGSKLLFRSRASNLSEHDRNSEFDLFVYDTTAKTNQIASSVHLGFASAALGALEGQISNNGRYVVFSSRSSDFGPADTNNLSDIYRKDLQTGETIRISTPMDGSRLEGSSSLPRMSEDGNVIVFNSSSLALTADAQPGTFVHFVNEQVTRWLGNSGDLLRGILMPRGDMFVNFRGTVYQLSPTEEISTCQFPAGSPPRLHSLGTDSFIYHGALPGTASTFYRYHLPTRSATAVDTNVVNAIISRNGRYVAYEQRQYTSGVWRHTLNLFEAETKSKSLLHTFGTSTTSQPPAGLKEASFSEDGRFLAFTTPASLQPWDTDASSDLYIYDRMFGTTLLLSQYLPGGSEALIYASPHLSGNGRFLAFATDGSSLVTQDLNQTIDVFIYELQLADSDNDQLEDGWEIAWFGNLAEGPNNDPDNDGTSNLVEFQAGTNPTSGASVFAVYRITNLQNGSVVMLWPSLAGRKYQLQSKTDLDQAWENVGEPVIASSNTTERIEKPDTTRFYRVVLLP